MKKFFFFICFFHTCMGILSVSAQNDALVSIEKHVQDFQSRYGIPLIYKDLTVIGANIDYQLITTDEYVLLNDYLTLFEQEINKYPPEFFRDREIRGIALVTHLFSNKMPAQGIYSTDGKVMFFDILRFTNNTPLKRHSIHHELFHMMAFQTPGYILEDEQWSALNAAGFVYGKQKKPWTDVNPVNPQAPNQLGFVTDYAMTSVEEDKAEVFACLMQEKHRMLITRWAQKDEVMGKKIQAIKDFVALYCPQMNVDYWNDGGINLKSTVQKNLKY